MQPKPTPAYEPCRRRSARESVLLAGSAFAFARSTAVVVSDVSLDGAQLDGRDLPPAGQDVMMVVGSFDTLAKVAWRNGDKCGIAFDDPVGDATIAQMKQEAAWAAVTGWYR